MVGSNLKAISALGTVLVSVGLVGCDSDSVTGLGETFDARASAQIVETAVSSEWVNLSTGHASLIILAVKNTPQASLVPGLEDDRVGSLGERFGINIGDRLKSAAFQPRFSVTGRNGILPDEVLGKTYSLAGQTAGGYGVLPDQPDAPEFGARFLMYELDPVTSRPKLIPPSRAGQLDLLEPVPNQGLEVMATTKSGDLISDFSLERTVVDGVGTYSSTLTSAGALAKGSRFDYTMMDHVSFSNGFSRADFQFDRDLKSDERDIHVTYNSIGYVTSEEGDAGQVDLLMTIRSDGHVVEVDVTETGSFVTGTVTYDGQTMVHVSGDPFDPTFTRPDGTLLAGAELNGMWDLYYSFDVALYFGDELLIPLSTLML